MKPATQAEDRKGGLAELVLGFVEGSPEVRDMAVFDAEGRQLTATDGRDWGPAAVRLWTAAGGEEGTNALRWVHVGTKRGEVLALRDAAGSAMALTDRFPLAALVLSDLRAALRLVAAERKGGGA